MIGAWLCSNMESLSKNLVSYPMYMYMYTRTHFEVWRALCHVHAYMYTYSHTITNFINPRGSSSLIYVYTHVHTYIWAFYLVYFTPHTFIHTHIYFRKPRSLRFANTNSHIHRHTWKSVINLYACNPFLQEQILARTRDDRCGQECEPYCGNNTFNGIKQQHNQTKARVFLKPNRIFHRLQIPIDI